MSPIAPTNPLRDPQVWILWALSTTLGFSMGFFGPILAEYVHGLGGGETAIGVASTVYYGGLAIASSFAARWVRRWGARSATTVGLLAAAGTNAAVALCTSVGAVVFVRGIAGLGTGLLMVAAQAALIARAGAVHRAKVTGVYGIVSAVGFFVGPLVGPALYARSPLSAFAVGAGLLAGAGTLMLVAGRDVSDFEAPPRVPVAARLRVPLHATFACGFSESALIALYPAFLIGQGFALPQIGTACAAFVWGGAICTVPLSALADRIGRARILAICAVAGCIGAALLSCTTDPGRVVTLSVLVGAVVGPLFPISMALMGDVLGPDEFPSGSAAFTSAWGIGCVTGPFLTTASVALLGSRSIFLPTIAVFASLSLRAWMSKPLQAPRPFSVQAGPVAGSGDAQ
jgi:MFS family permease